MLRVHRAARSVELVDRLADVLGDPAGSDPFTPEVVSVHSRGIERWLAQELAQRLGTSAGRQDGIAAHIAFPFPKTVVDWALGGMPVSGLEDRPRDPWDPARSMWTLLRLLDRTDPAELGQLGSHIAGDHGRMRRAPAMRHVAELFDRYAVHRPSLLHAWQDGRDVDGRGRPLAEPDQWQPRLWRRLRDVLGPSFAERVADVVAGRRELQTDGFPGRLSLFGLTALPSTYLDVLTTLAAGLDVHLFVLHPSPALWTTVAPAAATLSERPLRSEDPTAGAAHHPLLSSWGRDSRELQLLLAGADTEDVGTSGASGHVPPPATLLQRLQADLIGNRPPPGTPLPGEDDDRHVLTTAHDVPLAAAADLSVQVHACHGRLRQVEVLRDVVLGLLSDDPTLQPRDIVVMCPDVEAFAPLVEAVFTADSHVEDGAPGAAADATATSDPERLPDVRVRIADRALKEINPLLRTVAGLLAMPDGRVEASAVVELAHQTPVRRRFGFSTADLEVVEGWIEQTGIRWGLDLDHRRRQGLDTEANTWRAGLDRLLLGVAVAPEGPDVVAGLRPHDEVEGSAAELAGRLAELIQRIDAMVDDLAAPRPVADWCKALRHHVGMLTRVDDGDAWQQRQLDRLLDDLLDTADDAGGPPDLDDVQVDLTLPELRSLLADRLQGRPSRANHRTGDLTVCTLVPMRSVPYRVVCLLGLDDETFPRRTVPSGDDLIARHARVGDRDPRTEDRQLLLDALLAAGDNVVITYTGRDERTDAATPPAVPLAELLDAIDATARTDREGLTAGAAITRRHPLRAADARCFDAAAPFGFDPIAHAGARARREPPRPAPRFLDALPPPAEPPTTVTWADFTRLLRNPAKQWLRTRLGVSLRASDDTADDLMPLEVDALENWQVGTRLLRGCLDGQLDAWLAAERGRGLLPVGAVGDALLDDLVEEVRLLATIATQRFGSTLDAAASTREIDVTVAGVRLVGAVEDIRGDVLARVDYGRPKAKRILDLWLPWLVLAADDRPVEAVLVSRGKSSREAARTTSLGTDIDPADARELLGQLVELYLRGLQEPLPLFETASGEYAKGLLEDADTAYKLGSTAWLQGRPGNQWGDGLDESVLQVFGRLTFDEVVALEATDFEQGDGWDETQPGRFARLAQRLWTPVFSRCSSEAVPA